MDIKQTASRDLWPIWPSHKIISDISTNQEIFIFSYFYCQGFKTESCPSKSFPLLPLPHLARPQVYFKNLSRPQVGVKLQVVKKYENVKGQQIDLPAGNCWPAQKVACLSSQYTSDMTSFAIQTWDHLARGEPFDPGAGKSQFCTLRTSPSLWRFRSVWARLIHCGK